MESHGESRNKAKKTVYALCALTAAGYLGAYAGRSFGLREQVQEICEQYATERRIALTISTNDGSRMGALDVPALFSRYESFRPGGAPDASDRELDSRVGFKFEYTKNEEEVPEDEDSFRLPKRTIYNFTVTRDDGNVCEGLMISRYDSGEPLSHTHIELCPVSGYQRVSAGDIINNTKITLRKENSSSEVEFDPSEIDEAGARNLWDIHLALFYEFRRQHGIDARIAQYSPRMELEYPLENNP